MENNLNKGSFFTKVIIVVVLILVILGGIYLYSNKKIDAPTVDENNQIEILGNKEDLVSFSVKAGDIVSGMLNLSGSVVNAYFFEGNILINLLDSNKNILKQGFGTASTDWMTTGPVSFTSSIDSTGLNGSGFILIQNDDPSDGEGGPAKKILIPVIFENENQEMMSVKVYFPNSVTNPGFMDCNVVQQTSRTIPYTLAVGEASLRELIKGPTTEEKIAGFQTQVDINTTVKSITIKEGTAYVDFSKDLQNKNIGLCAGQFIQAQIKQTLLQFPTIKNTVISIEGNKDFVQP